VLVSTVASSLKAGFSSFSVGLEGKSGEVWEVCFFFVVLTSFGSDFEPTLLIDFKGFSEVFLNNSIFIKFDFFFRKRFVP